MKFHDKLVSLRQLNSPNKFKICCIDMYFLRFLANFAGFRGLPGLPEFRGSAPALNIKSPATMSCVIYIIQTGDKKFASGDYISPVGRQKAT